MHRPTKEKCPSLSAEKRQKLSSSRQWLHIVQIISLDDVDTNGMILKSFADLQHKPLLVDLTVEEGQRLKVIFGSHTGFHVIDVDSGNSYDIYIPSHVSLPKQTIKGLLHVKDLFLHIFRSYATPY